MNEDNKVDFISVTVLKRVGLGIQALLANLNIYTIQDLLFHLPLRYQDRRYLTPIAAVRHGDQVVVEGKIQLANLAYTRRRNLICCIRDSTGSLLLRFYHFNLKQQERLTKVGLTLRCFGSVRKNYQGRLEMEHPEYQIMDKEVPLEDCLTPIYSTTKGLRQTQWRHLMAQALEYLKANNIEELLPESLRKLFQLPTLMEALIYVHRPPQEASVDLLQAGIHPTQKRLAFEELLAQQVGLQRLRLQIKIHRAPILESNSWQEKLREALFFPLTTAQQRVIKEINKDLSMPSPMLRLVQGDVGSGKTIIAAMSVMKVLENNYQSAVMAPTELLAEQHYQVFQRWFKPLGINVGYLVGNLSKAVRKETLHRITSGEHQVVVGTHALFQEAVIFRNLALVVIDEQHRFGVHQRLALKEKGLTEKNSYPHQLIMTATPIPRTLAMTMYADLDISVIDELPPGRRPISTVIISNTRREKVIEGIKKICEQGKQAYWICTLIKESETVQCETTEATYKHLQQSLTNLKIGLIHGRLNKNEKEAVMAAFKVGKINLLVATTVVEVGVNVPNATLMIIENSERLGLVQIHQLRGRVGRGEDKSHCVLLYQGPLSNNARNRLSFLRDSQDGFVIAQKDLELRGVGELLGTRQAGLFHFRIANMARDFHLLPSVQKMSHVIVQHYPHVIDRLLHRWLKRPAAYWDV
ncbi:ATP-dependent DNA helicase RecG [Coxiella endosymbiont of Amblyomma nuttalli]|uniref:ATP-dependent DNA helicase RecG n=1 Tax=Coxiella endosymbiont of Amblyomma nuttalli TaxID=2749996 RepID=UPI001BA8CF3C|nr:ATP-dependent DNA helicase RecG [Coxiella endosymbiont of Amblyomma nuttalli]QTS83836.1 ATP-dependent DNA helicase RecG [Coxiella endosymbiont of Amblyomma nuttalli]